MLGHAIFSFLSGVLRPGYSTLGEWGEGWSDTQSGTGCGSIRRRISANFSRCCEISGLETTRRPYRSVWHLTITGRNALNSPARRSRAIPASAGSEPRMRDERTRQITGS